MLFGLAITVMILAMAFAIPTLAMRRRQKAAKARGSRYDDWLIRPFGVIVIVACVVAVILTIMSCVYSQDTGEVIVIRNWGGSLAGYTSEAGFHGKAPWQDTIKYDIRNNTINLYHSDTEYSVDGGSAVGPCVTINDSGGASADVDVQVIYSLSPDSALNLYADYGTQTNFVQNYILNEVRATTREVAGQYDTMTMLTSRGDFTDGLTKALAKKWQGKGLNVEQVNIQDVRYPDTITSKYAEAQAAEVAKQQAQNEQETARVEAETKKIKAQGDADANAIQTQQLTPEVLQKQYIDALNNAASNGGLIVVPEGSTPMIDVSK